MTEYILHTSTRCKNKLGEINSEIRDKKLPELYSRREECCGCSACYSICPKDAITMKPDEEGFLYPRVDADKCVLCYKCLSVCAFKAKQNKTHEN